MTDFDELTWEMVERESRHPRPAGGVMTPLGHELVDPDWCDSETRVLSPRETKELLAQVAKLEEEESRRHSRPTVRHMTAVTAVQENGPKKRPSLELQLQLDNSKG